MAPVTELMFGCHIFVSNFICSIVNHWPKHLL